MLCAAGSAFIVKIIVSRTAVMHRRGNMTHQNKEEGDATISISLSSKALGIAGWAEVLREIV
jgi:hypothetical protein